MTGPADTLDRVVERRISGTMARGDFAGPPGALSVPRWTTRTGGVVRRRIPLRCPQTKTFGGSGMGLEPGANPGRRSRRREVAVIDRRKTRRRRVDVVSPAATDAQCLRAAFATLDKFNRGVLLIDRDRGIAFANRAAEDMAGRDNGIVIERRRLRFEPSAAHAAFEAYLARGAAAGDSLVLRVDGTRLRSPYRVLVSPLNGGEPATGTGVRYSVFVYEPNGGQQPPPVPVLRQLYGLTAAEARLVNALFAGVALPAAARALGISINTAKSALKSVYTKCAVCSRAELLLLVSLGPRTL